MLRALGLAITTVVLSLAEAGAAGPSDLGANAALKYWQGFATLPTFSDAESQKLHAEYLTLPLDAPARKTVAKADYSLKMMHYGAALPHCDWGLVTEEGVEALLPHAPAARVLSSLAFVRARLRFDDGRPDEAIDDIVSAMTMARHVSIDGSLICVLVGYAIESRANETLALYLPKLDAASTEQLQTRLDNLPTGGRPADGMKLEEATLDWFIGKVNRAANKNELVAILSKLSESGENRDASAQGRKFLQECGGTAEGVVKFAEEALPCYARAAKMLDLPIDRFVTEWDRQEAKEASNPVFRRLFPAVRKVRESQARFDVRQALLRAALDVQLKGPDALKQHPDPLTGQAFEYVEFDGGFELRFKFKPDDKRREKWKFDPHFDESLTLTVGRR